MKKSDLGRTYKDGEIICREGEEGKGMFVILSGKVEVTKKVPDGELTIAILNKGEMFGEMALFDRLPRSATVRAHGEAVVLSIDKKGFIGKVSEDPTLSFNILESMSRRIRTLTNELTKLKKDREKVFDMFLDMGETARLILEEIRHSIQADNGSIMLLEEETDVLFITAAFGTEQKRKTRLARGRGIAGDVMNTGKIELINNISADPRYEPGDMNMKALLCAPLRRRKKIFGVINLSHSRDNFFNLDDLKLLRVLSIYASIAIENATLFVKSQKISDSILKHVTLLDM